MDMQMASRRRVNKFLTIYHKENKNEEKILNNDTQNNNNNNRSLSHHNTINNLFTNNNFFSNKLFNEENGNVELMIMDPHATGNPDKGLYIITLDKDGEFVKIEPDALVLASRSIYFSKNKPWMAYIPKTK